MSVFLRRVSRAALRVVQDSTTQTQAVAFNMFLAFSPMILVVLGAVAGSSAFRQAVQGIIERLRVVLPPGTVSMLSGFLSRHHTHPWQWVLLGLGGTLLAGTQMMKLLVEGFRIVYREYERQNVVIQHLRAQIGRAHV